MKETSRDCSLFGFRLYYRYLLSLLVTLLLLPSPVTQAQSQASVNLAQQMFVAYYGRPGDPGGLNYWAGQFDESSNLDAVLFAFGDSQEYNDSFGTLTKEQLVNGLFLQMFNRDSDPGGLAFYVGRLESGEATLASIAKQIADGSVDNDLLSLNNKITVANDFSSRVEAESINYVGSDIPTAQVLIGAVTFGEDAITDGITAVSQWAESKSSVASAEQNFVDNIAGPILSEHCLFCHVPGGPSGNSRLVFDGDETDNKQNATNMAVFANFLVTVEDGADLILNKVQGIDHPGGEIFTNGSEKWAALDNYLQILGLTNVFPGEDNGGGENPSDIEPGDSTAEQYFEQHIAAGLLEAKCLNCHIEEGVSGNTRLVFSNDGADDQNASNIAVFETFLATVDDGANTILTKIQGVGHGGGALFGSGTNEWQALSNFLTLLGAEEQTGQASGEFWQGITLADRRQTLRRAALIVAGHIPADSKLDAAAVSDANLRTALRELMEGDAFHGFLISGANDRLLTDAFSSGLPFDLADDNYPFFADLAQKRYDFFETNGEGNETSNQWWEEFFNSFYWGMVRSPLELIAYVVENDKPYTEILTADYMMLNSQMSEVFRSGLSFSDDSKNNFKPGKHNGQIVQDDQFSGDFVQNIGHYVDSHSGFIENYPHAGVLNTHAYLNRYPTTETNRNRARSRWTNYHFLGVDIEKSAARTTDPEALADTNNPTLNNPSCTVCHTIMDPVAGAFANYGDEGWFKSSWGGKDALPETYKYPQYYSENAEPSIYVEGDTWFRDMLTPGFDGSVLPNPNTGLPWLAGQITNDSRFAMASVRFWWSSLMGYAPLEAPSSSSDINYDQELLAFTAQQQDFQSLAEGFRSGFNGGSAYQLKDLLTEMILSNWFRAESASQETISGKEFALASAGTGRLLTPRELDNKTRNLLGWSWGSNLGDNEDDPEYHSDLINSYRIYYGGIDSYGVTERAIEITPLMSNVAARQAYHMACPTISYEFSKPDSQRKFFSGLSRYITPQTEATMGLTAEAASYASRDTVSFNVDIGAGSRLIKINYHNAAWDETLQQGRQLYIANINISQNGQSVLNVGGEELSNQSGFSVSEWIDENTNESGVDGDVHAEEISPDVWEEVAFVLWGWNSSLEFDWSVAESGAYQIELDVWATQLPDGEPGSLTVSVSSHDPYENTLGSQVIKSKIIELHDVFLGEKLTLDSDELNYGYQFFVESWLDRMGNPEAGIHGSWPAENCPFPEDMSNRTDEQWNDMHNDPQRVMGTWSSYLVYLMTDYGYLHE